MERQNLADRVANKMLEEDQFSNWMGIKILENKPGYSQLQMTIRPEMMSAFGICHGGVTFALADSAFAFAANNHGRLAVALDTTISFPKAVYEGDVVTATAEEVSRGKTVAVYNVAIRNQDGLLVGMFKGTAYRRGKEHFPGESFV